MTTIAIDNAAYFHRLAKRARKHPAAGLLSGSPQLARHEAGHAAAAVALGGTVLDLSERYCLAALKVGSRGDDAQWVKAVFWWAGCLAAGTLAGAYDDLVSIKALGRQYLTGRDEYSAFHAARLIVNRHREQLEEDACRPTR